jgi:filamentous hemagglutinin family protein
MREIYWFTRYFLPKFTGLLGYIAVCLLAPKAVAQQSNIVPDNTLGAESSEVLPNYQGQPIEAITGGAARGINLFHSFEELNISEGRGLYFLSPNAEIQNIFSRVTGRSGSEILGTLGIYGDSPANLFLINPSGIVFGENASLDVGGSFVATTANGLQFGNQGVFSATNPEAPSQLLTVSPSALFFNAIANQKIVNRSRANTNVLGSQTIGLQVPNGKSLLLLGGDIDVDSGGLFAFGGRVQLGGLSTQGSVELQENDNNLSFIFPKNVELANVIFRNNAFVNVSSAGGGDININARNVEFSESGLQAGIAVGNGTLTSKAGDININATETINLTENSYIYNTLQTNATGTAGDININAGSLNLDSGTTFSASTYGKGDAGNIFINASDVVSLKGSGTEIFNDVEPGAVGNGGEINIKAGSLTLSERAQIEASVVYGNANQPAGRGNAGNISIEARDEISLDNALVQSIIGNGAVGDGGDINIKAGSLFASNDASISASTYGKGKAGNVIINASDLIDLKNARIFSTVEAGGVGKGGDISIKASTLSLFDNAQLLTSIRTDEENQPSGQGNAGNVNINVAGAVTISGIRNGFSSGIFSNVETGAVGNGGEININSGSFSLTDKAKLVANTAGEGSAGNISINASDSVILNDAPIFNSVEAGGVGNAGNVEINSASLSLQDTAQILTLVSDADGELAAGRGNAGNVNINVSGTVAIADSQKGSFRTVSGIGSDIQAGAVGNAGNITITGGSLLFDSGAQISTNTSGEGNAGNVFLNAKDLISLTGDARIFSMVRAGAVGIGGNVEINANSLSLQDSTWLMTSTNGQGSASNVIINARENVLFNGGNIYSTVSFGGVGNGGNIFIKAGNLTLNNSSLQTLVRGTYENLPAGRGNAGEINIDVRDTVNISGVDAGLYSLIEEGAIGNGGNIDIKTGSFLISNGAELFASVFGKGSAGNININARENVQFDRANAYSTVGYLGEGKGGDINIKAGSLFFTNGTEIYVSTFGIGSAGNLILDAREIITFDNSRADSTVAENAIGNGGEIRINTGNLSILNDAFLNASTYGQGSSGNIDINARENISFDNGSVSSGVSENAVGKGGNVRINTDLLSLSSKSQIQISTFGRGDAGNIIIDARDSVWFDGISGTFSRLEREGVGKGGDIRINTGSFSVTSGAQLTASTLGQGDAGNIQIKASENVNLAGSSMIDGFSSGLLSTTFESSVGKGGNIAVDTKNFRLSEGALLSTRTRTDSKGGNITVNADNLEVINGAQLLTTTSSSGSAGTININATKGVVIDGSDATFNDMIARFPDILDDRYPTANSGLFVSSTASGTTGDIKVTSPKINLDNQGVINAESTSGNGGNINLEVADLLLMRRGGQISTNAGTAQQGGDGGNIDINSGFIVAVPNENNDITANAFTGTGGKVLITSLGVFGIEPRQQSNNITSDITASSDQGVQGVTTVDAPDNSSIQNSLNQLSENPIDANALIANSCIARRNTPSSGTFFITGKGGLPERPGEAGISRFSTGGMQDVSTDNVSESPRGWKIGDPIVEPTGVYKLADGRLILSRECD